MTSQEQIGPYILQVFCIITFNGDINPESNAMIIDDKGFPSGLTPNNMKFKMGFCVSEPKQRNGS